MAPRHPVSPPPRAPGPTDKALATRARIAEAALTCFERAGYAATTMRDIATEAGCAVGLAYRYFPGKEALVLELYAGLQQQLSERLTALPAGATGARFGRAMAAKLDLIEPHRGALLALAAVAFDPAATEGVLSAPTTTVRGQGMALFVELVRGSDDAPDDPEPLGRALYALHLLLVLLWTQDTSPGATTTRGAVSQLEGALALLVPLARLEAGGAVLARADALLAPLLRGPLAQVL